MYNKTDTSREVETSCVRLKKTGSSSINVMKIMTTQISALVMNDSVQNNYNIVDTTSVK